jgi:hypothetical protein
MPETEMVPETTTSTRERILGKYRGIVSMNVDPERRGRLQAIVKEVLGEIPTGWATPCAPYAGFGAGFFSVPPPGAGVWIEFEAGDVSRPIWSGCYWGTGEAPMVPPASALGEFTTKIWRSDLGLTTAFDDVLQTITISDALGTNKIVVDVKAGMVTVKGLAMVVLEAPLIREGSAFAMHPAVFGDQLLTYLAQLVTIFNTHVHPGQMAAGILPVTPAPPVAPMPPPSPSLVSVKVALE